MALCGVPLLILLENKKMSIKKDILDKLTWLIKWGATKGVLTESKSEIIRLRQALEDAAQYHEVYVEKLKDSDPERSARQQQRADYLRSQIK